MAKQEYSHVAIDKKGDERGDSFKLRIRKQRTILSDTLCELAMIGIRVLSQVISASSCQRNTKIHNRA